MDPGSSQCKENNIKLLIFVPAISSRVGPFWQLSNRGHKGILVAQAIFLDLFPYGKSVRERSQQWISSSISNMGTRIQPCECELRRNKSSVNSDESWEPYKSPMCSLESSQNLCIPGSPQSLPNKYKSAYVDCRILPAVVAWVYQSPN